MFLFHKLKLGEFNFRDDPNEMPNFVAINEAKVDCKIHCKGDNLFCAVK